MPTLSQTSHRRLVRLSQRSGFTLIELLLAVVMLGILLAIGAPKVYQLTTRSKVNQAAMTVAADLEQAVSLAARERRPVTITLEATGRYVVKDRATSPDDTVRIRRDLNFRTDGGVRLLAFNPATVTVFPNGMVDQSLIVTVSSDGYSRHVTMSAAGQVRAPQ
jgi:prepilin-type N-terminal cleavage/methylation domain-containing protein